MQLRGLEAQGLGEDPARRRAAIVTASDRALEGRIVEMAQALREAPAEAIARFASLPLAEVVASPFGLRAVAMAAGEGALSRHRELRYEPAGSADPEVADPDHNEWVRGALRTGKYQGFYAESPFATYDPSHHAKWASHELMHRAVGFAFRADMPRFERYVAARLNELIPVVLFHALDEVMRLEGDGFDVRRAGSRKRARIEECAFWNGRGLASHATRTAGWLRTAVIHFERELAAIDEELARGRRVKVSHDYAGAFTLDASSDATAYVVGHAERLEAPEVARALGAVDARWRAETAAELRDRVEQTFDRLLFASLEWNEPLANEHLEARRAWDLAHRRAIALTFGERTQVASIDGALEGDDGRLALAQLEAGLRQGSAASLASDEADLARFARSRAIWDRAPLAERWASFLGEGPRGALAQLEAAIVGAVRDDAIEHLGSAEGAQLVWSDAVRVLSLEVDALSAHAAYAESGVVIAPEPTPQHLLIVGIGHSVSVVAAPEALARIAGRPQDDLRDAIAAAVAPDDPAPWIDALLAAGVIGRR
ncbi:MAG: hypothetical protein AB7S26_00865 [Sandaracinaceae bacterium]